MAPHRPGLLMLEGEDTDDSLLSCCGQNVIEDAGPDTNITTTCR